MTSFIYQCAQCGGTVTKKPTGTKQGKGSEVVGLGGWRCASCGAGIKVKRKIVEQ